MRNVPFFFHFLNLFRCAIGCACAYPCRRIKPNPICLHACMDAFVPACICLATAPFSGGLPRFAVLLQRTSANAARCTAAMRAQSQLVFC